MQRATYSVTIHAPKEKVWHVLLEDATYRQWTSAFHEGSYAVTDWKEGSSATFLTPEGEGMFSRIAAHRPNEFLSIEHLGTIKDGQEMLDDEQSKEWKGAHENYKVQESGGVTTLTIEMDLTEQYKAYFDEVWPKALAKVKEIAESASRTASS
jgi:uncharacterized protein YndB with AHSA1/START domain